MGLVLLNARYFLRCSNSTTCGTGWIVITQDAWFSEVVTLVSFADLRKLDSKPSLRHDTHTVIYPHTQLSTD